MDVWVDAVPLSPEEYDRLVAEHERGVVEYLGWGGRPAKVETDLDLGRGRFRTPQYGVRRAIWDASFGYVSGFPLRDILYFVVTRSLSPRIFRWAFAREHR